MTRSMTNSVLFYCGVDEFCSITSEKLCKIPVKVDDEIAFLESSLDLFIFSKYSSEQKWFAKGFGLEHPIEIFPESLQINQVKICQSTVYGLSTFQNKLYQAIFKFNEDKCIGREFSEITVPFPSATSRLRKISANDDSLFAIDDKGGIYKLPDLLFRCELNFTKLACGFDHNLVLTDTGAVYSFGNGSRGQLGHPSIVLRCDKPTRIEFFDDLPCIVTDISCGGWHSLALTSDGDLYCFGWNLSSQLGHSTDQLSSVVKDPYPLDLGSHDNPIIQACAGARHSFALLKKGDIYGWGWNKYYQLGTGDNEDRSSPTAIPQDKLNFGNPYKISSSRWGTFIFCHPKPTNLLTI